uniref:Uncharacterized protein n=1 Tax=Opuntia streptacantha TaxID=393608 RepID=A0A7C9A3Y4_OPUST
MPDLQFASTLSPSVFAPQAQPVSHPLNLTFSRFSHPVSRSAIPFRRLAVSITSWPAGRWPSSFHGFAFASSSIWSSSNDFLRLFSLHSMASRQPRTSVVWLFNLHGDPAPLRGFVPLGNVSLPPRCLQIWVWAALHFCALLGLFGRLFAMGKLSN